MKNALLWQFNRIKSYLGRPRLLVQERPVVLDGVEPCAHPLFIIGAHRSGTSLVRRLFNSHPDIACPPESFFIEKYAKMASERLVLAGYDGFGYTAEQTRADLARKASELHEAFRLAQGKSIWADKTPRYVDSLDAIDRLFAKAPCYLMVYRHPWDIVYSISKRGWNFTNIPDPFESALVYVRDSIERMRKFEAAIPARCSRIVYRELCENPAAALTRAMEPIGLAYHPDMLDFASKNHNYGLEDPTIRGRKTISYTAGAWTNWSAAQTRRAQELLDPADFADIC